MLAGAQTGTGKTAGFTLPILQRLAVSDRQSKAPRALVLTPTRELALQVAESVREYGRYLSLRSSVIFGGVSINPQIDSLARGTDIIIATPGRLLDHCQQRTVDLIHIEVLVLDEPTSALDVSIQKQVLELLQDLQKNRGLSYVLITHDLAVVRAMAHQVMVLHQGRCVEQGRLEEVLQHPKDAYTKALIEA